MFSSEIVHTLNSTKIAAILITRTANEAEYEQEGSRSKIFTLHSDDSTLYSGAEPSVENASGRQCVSNHARVKHSKFQLHPDVAAAPPPTATSPVSQRVSRYVEQRASVRLCDVRGLTLMLKV